jgi:hypothetical protein
MVPDIDVNFLSAGCHDQFIKVIVNLVDLHILP